MCSFSCLTQYSRLQLCNKNYVGQCPTWWPPCRIWMAPSVQRRKVWLTPSTKGPCNNAAKTRNPLKLAGVPQTRHRISAVSGPKFTILRKHVEEILLFKICFILSICALVAKISPDQCVRWCADSDFWRRPNFCVLHFQRATCSTFETCILDSH